MGRMKRMVHGTRIREKRRAYILMVTIEEATWKN
jgi:hypothetical protein